MTNDERGINLMNSWARLYGKVYVLWFGPTAPLLVAYHPDTTRAVLSSDEPKDEQFYSFLRPWIGDGLLVSRGDKWSRNRRLLTKAFHFQVLQPYVELFSESTNILLKKWHRLDGERTTIELYGDISLLTLDSLTTCIFGINTNCQDTKVKHPYTTAVLDMLILINRRMRFLPYHSDLIYYFSVSGYRFRRACRVAHDFSRKVVLERQHARRGKVTDDQSKNKYLNFIDILLEAKDEDGTGLSNDEIFDEVDTFMFEGHDTTACGLSWLLHNLARHPEYQEKCRQEAIDVLGSRNALEWEDLPKLQYINQCMKESLRLHPPVLSIARRTENGVPFEDGRTTSNGASIVVDINGTHHNPELWPNPEVYDPDRFAQDTVQNRSPFSYIPFSAGPR
ncbi:Cytochrome P450 4F2 [Lamellibrachia satsuma]|nr:Cytochrome P450 4F2 [Lamellibrachia satsuma]